jgi:hypothetical protein
MYSRTLATATMLCLPGPHSLLSQSLPWLAYCAQFMLDEYIATLAECVLTIKAHGELASVPLNSELSSVSARIRNWLFAVDDSILPSSLLARIVPLRQRLLRELQAVAPTVRRPERASQRMHMLPCVLAPGSQYMPSI